MMDVVVLFQNLICCCCKIAYLKSFF